MLVLTHDLVQPIVDKMVQIIGKNINIMNEQAIIIACRDLDRLGSFHRWAAQVIQSGRTIEVFTNDIDPSSGGKPGINLPIIFKGQIVGVVGITGLPEEIGVSAKLVRTSVELMLDQLQLKEQLNLELRAKERFLGDLCNGDIEVSEEIFLTRASVLGFDLSVPRYAIVFDIDDFNENLKTRSSIHNLPPDELAVQLFKEEILQSAARTKGFGGKEILTHAGGSKIVVFKDFAGSDRNQSKKEAESIIEKVQRAIQHDVGITTTVGVGRLYQHYSGYSNSLREAVEAISIGRSLRSGGHIFWSEEMPLENLLTAAPKQVLEDYIHAVMGTFLTERFANQREEIFQTLEALFENNLSLTQTAHALFLHRNTILFRLEKIEKLTGYKPATSFDQAIKLKLAIMAWRYLS
ncbi:CdaR family transcriptional regulator [Desulfosporosinus metallidurans]|uniref:Sugar diacid utilization regulator SdaR n=1 Tax=Desulfosporosinus metallidurans TaxID=1888891 RepID=A0A1Q8QXA4_9FIRM|nr:sugar diacid recognition domain-containing protein [Desulfosporosinus metallidurans]OLN31972.1 Sugar diacid utilization regulator SdaR [Desulfosporosinus metallidurans]